MTDYDLMKSLIALFSSLLLCSCADMVVTRTEVAGSSTAARGEYYDSKNGVHMISSCGVGLTHPKAIYVRPFCVDTAIFSGHQTPSEGEMPIRKAIAPIEFAEHVKESLERLAPAR